MLTLAMEPTKPAWYQRIIHSLFGRIFLNVLTTLVVTAICPFLFFVNRLVPVVWLRYLAVMLVGLAAGFSATALLATYPTLLRYLVGWGSTIVGLYALYQFTAGYAGVPILAGRQAFIEWSSLSFLLLGLATTWLAVSAWKPFSSRKITTSVQKIRRRAKLPLTKINRQTRLVLKTNGKSSIRSGSVSIFKPRFWHTKFNQFEKKLANWQHHTRTSIASSHQKANRWLAKTILTPTMRLRSRQNTVRLQQARPLSSTRIKSTNVRLMGRAENRCPYCLEIVKANDPRGIKICPECHTYHHADCWEVTGTCQVPHYHE